LRVEVRLPRTRRSHRRSNAIPSLSVPAWRATASRIAR